jgi:predicted RNase H-like HicB family nuclease
MEKFYPIVVCSISAADGGGYLGLAPDLPGCMSHGDTPEEAMASASEAVLEWIDEAREQGRDIPEPGASGLAARADRKRLLDRLKEQQKKFEEMDAEVRSLRASIEELLGTLSQPHMADELTWTCVCVKEGKKRSTRALQ